MNKTEHKFPYKWTLKDAHFTKDKGTVFSCFACGGGSTMGYKLAGYDVIGCNEIDPRMNKVYVANHHPKHNYLMDIRELVKKAQAHELPDELYNLDVLDGSPPCSSFSTVGVREDGWGKEKHFREGQTAQVLDTLFFDFIDLAKELQPKVIIAENVKGLTLGEAKKYMCRIYQEFGKANYEVCHYLLDASVMGVPQKRERVFFLAIRNDLKDNVSHEGLFDNVCCDMSYNEKPILFSEICDYNGRRINEETKTFSLWKNQQESDTNLGDVAFRLYGKKTQFSTMLFSEKSVAYTITPDYHCSLLHKEHPFYLSDTEISLCSTFPTDYDYQGQKPGYFCGMSVPPVMMAQVASRVYEQWLSKINTKC